MNEETERLPEVAPVNPVVTQRKLEFAWNYEDVKAYLVKATEKYTGLIVTDENLEDSQKAKRELVAMRQKVKKFRTVWKPALQKPANDFSKQVDELLAVITEKEDALAAQLDVYEKKRKDKLYESICTEYWAKASHMGLDAARFDIEGNINQKWFNKTQRWSDTCNDIDALIRMQVAEQKAAEAREDMLKSRIAAAKAEVENASREYRLASPLKLGDIVTDTGELADMAWDDVRAKIQNAASHRHELEEAARAPKEEPKPEPVPEPPVEEPMEEPVEGIPPMPELPEEEGGVPAGMFPKRYILTIDITDPMQDEVFQDVMRMFKEYDIHGTVREAKKW